MTSAQTAGYSGTPLPRKLGIKAGHRVLFHDAPEGFDPQPLPGDVTVDRAVGAGPYDVIVTFVPDRASLEESYATLPAKLVKNGALWVCWPKKASKVVTDVTENVVRDEALWVPTFYPKVAMFASKRLRGYSIPVTPQAQVKFFARYWLD